MIDKLFQILNHLSGRPSIKQHSLHISIWVNILHVMAIKQGSLHKMLRKGPLQHNAWELVVTSLGLAVRSQPIMRQ